MGDLILDIVRVRPSSEGDRVVGDLGRRGEDDDLVLNVGQIVLDVAAGVDEGCAGVAVAVVDGGDDAIVPAGIHDLMSGRCPG